jgi:hypothetical protein
MRLPVRPAAAAALACACAALPLHAQFKMPKVKVPGTKQTAAPVASDAQAGSVAFNDRVVEITPARLDQLLKGLEAEDAMAAKVNGQDLKKMEKDNEAARAAYDKQMAAYTPTKQAWDACMDREQAKAQAKMDGATAGMHADFDQSKMDAIAARIQAAQKKGDMAEVMRLSDSVGKAAQAASARGTDVATASSAEVRKACGAEPAEPEAPKIQEPIGSSQVHQAGMQASGLGGQYDVLRERVAAYVASKGKTNGYAYTGSELAALQSKMDALSQHAETLRTF